VINKNNGSAMMGEQGNASMQNLNVTLKNTRPGNISVGKSAVKPGKIVFADAQILLRLHG